MLQSALFCVMGTIFTGTLRDIVFYWKNGEPRTIVPQGSLAPHLALVRGWKCGVLWGCPPTLHSISDPPTAPHACRYCQTNCVVVRWVQMGVSIWGYVHMHSADWWALSGAGVQAPWHGVLETVWLLCGEAQQVACLQGLEDCLLV